MNISELYQLFVKNPQVTTDSRVVPLQSIYFALKGDKFDGNAFAYQALEKGASFAIIDNKEYFIDDRTILVEDSLVTLQLLANYHRKKLGTKIVGITGTNGKTTTKELIKSVLSQKYSVYATLGNLNNHIGVPLTLLALTERTEIAIIEMGANHPFEIEQLCRIAEPDFGLITNIGKAHLEGFGGFEGVIKTKRELYDHLISKEGVIFYNCNNSLLAGLLESYDKKVSYGREGESVCYGRVVNNNPYLEVEITSSDANGDAIHAKSNLAGVYNFENILAAACIGLYFNVSLAQIREAIESYIPTNNRSQLNDTGRNKLLLDCYNANPSSTEAALKNFGEINATNKVVILGDMLELGDESVAEHLKMLDYLKGLQQTTCILVGPQYTSLVRVHSYGFIAFQNSDELYKWLMANPIQQSFILIKGSRGIKLEKVVELL